MLSNYMGNLTAIAIQNVGFNSITGDDKSKAA
jgi:hypothetical protein